MGLKNNLLSSFILFENQVDTSSYVHNIRSSAIKKFETLGFPKKQEAWKYTSLDGLLKNNFSIFPKNDPIIEYKDIKPFLVYGIDSYKVVFVNGIYSSYLSETSHDGMDICIMSAAFSKPKYENNIKTYFNKTTNNKDHLTTLNTAFSKEGAYICIPKGKDLEKPIQIINISTEPNGDLLLQPRNLIVIGENSHAQIIEQHQNLTSSKVLSNTVTEIFAEKNAQVDYYKIQNDPNGHLIDNTYIKQASNSEVALHTFSFEGELIRNNLNFYQNGQHCNSILKGMTLTSGHQQVDHYTLVDHLHPNCESHQNYKGIYTGASTGIFNGKIIVNKIAQQINAYQQNDNILVGDKATINAKPQLEIFADDVRCSHGCTIGQLDKDALFYLNSRGIPKEEAEGMLLYAFSNNTIESIKIIELKKKINDLIADKLSVNLNFTL